jgi:hypothetical protein
MYTSVSTIFVVICLPESHRHTRSSELCEQIVHYGRIVHLRASLSTAPNLVLYEQIPVCCTHVHKVSHV